MDEIENLDGVTVAELKATVASGTALCPGGHFFRNDDSDVTVVPELALTEQGPVYRLCPKCGEYEQSVTTGEWADLKKTDILKALGLD